jgi:hypothetical protein
LVVGRGFPALVLRGVILLVGLAIVVVPFQEGVTVGTLIVLLPAVLASVYAPASPAPADGDPLRPEVLVLIPLVHLFHISCGLAGAVPANGRVHLSALRAVAVRFLLVQAIMAVIVALAAWLPTGRVDPVLEGAALVGLAGVALLVVWLQRVR